MRTAINLLSTVVLTLILIHPSSTTASEESKAYAVWCELPGMGDLMHSLLNKAFDKIIRLEAFAEQLKYDIPTEPHWLGVEKWFEHIDEEEEEEEENQHDVSNKNNRYVHQNGIKLLALTLPIPISEEHLTIVHAEMREQMDESSTNVLMSLITNVLHLKTKEVSRLGHSERSYVNVPDIKIESPSLLLRATTYNFVYAINKGVAIFLATVWYHQCDSNNNAENSCAYFLPSTPSELFQPFEAYVEHINESEPKELLFQHTCIRDAMRHIADGFLIF